MAAGQREQPFRIAHQVVFDRRRLHEEDRVQTFLEDLGTATRRFREGVAVAIGDDRRRNGQQRTERPKDEGDLILGDQVLIVGHHLLRAAGIVGILHRHLVTEQAALGVDVLGPQVVSLDEGLTVAGEVATL